MPQRTPLAPCNGNRGINRELKPTLRAQITMGNAVGLTHAQIGALTFLTPATVSTTLLRNPLRDEHKSLPRSGRPPILKRHDKRLILRIIRKNPKITYQVLKQESGVTVHKNTIYRMLKSEGITNWLAKRRPLLIPEVVAKRLAFCKKYKNWMYTEWCKIIFSDECSLERGVGA
jgi:Transposase